MKCQTCKYMEKGFLQMPNECGWFSEPYIHVVSHYTGDWLEGDSYKGDSPEWCPLKGRGRIESMLMRAPILWRLFREEIKFSKRTKEDNAKWEEKKRENDELKKLLKKIIK